MVLAGLAVHDRNWCEKRISGPADDCFIGGAFDSVEVSNCNRQLSFLDLSPLLNINHQSRHSSPDTYVRAMIPNIPSDSVPADDDH